MRSILLLSFALLLCTAQESSTRSSSAISSSDSPQSSSHSSPSHPWTRALGRYLDGSWGRMFDPWSPRTNFPYLPSLPSVNQWTAAPNPILQRLDAINAANLALSGYQAVPSEAAAPSEAVFEDVSGDFATLQHLQSEIAAQQMQIQVQKQGIKDLESSIRELHERLKQEKVAFKQTERELGKNIAFMVTKLKQYQDRLKAAEASKSESGSSFLSSSRSAGSSSSTQSQSTESSTSLSNSGSSSHGSSSGSTHSSSSGSSSSGSSSSSSSGSSAGSSSSGSGGSSSLSGSSSGSSSSASSGSTASGSAAPKFREILGKSPPSSRPGKITYETLTRSMKHPLKTK